MRRDRDPTSGGKESTCKIGVKRLKMGAVSYLEEIIVCVQQGSHAVDDV